MGAPTWTVASRSEGDSTAVQSSKRGSGFSRKDARDEQHEERSVVDRESMKHDLVVLQQAEVSALLVSAETEFRKAQMDEISFCFGETFRRKR